MANPHTLGPWQKRDVTRQHDDGSTELVANEVMAGTTRIALVDDPDDQAIIAAAPDMLAALKALDGYFKPLMPMGPESVPEVATMSKTTSDILAVWLVTRAAIAKAEGREG